MAYLIGDWPVDCIHPRKDEETFDTDNQLYIDPEECIDCGACVPVSTGVAYLRGVRD